MASVVAKGKRGNPPNFSFLESSLPKIQNVELKIFVLGNLGAQLKFAAVCQKIAALCSYRLILFSTTPLHRFYMNFA